MRAAQYIQTVLSLLALYSLAPVNAEHDFYSYFSSYDYPMYSYSYEYPSYSYSYEYPSYSFEYPSYSFEYSYSYPYEFSYSMNIPSEPPATLPPTVSPTSVPTIISSAPSVEPSSEPSSEPSVEPSADNGYCRPKDIMGQTFFAPAANNCLKISVNANGTIVGDGTDGACAVKSGLGAEFSIYGGWNGKVLTWNKGLAGFSGTMKFQENTLLTDPQLLIHSYDEPTQVFDVTLQVPSCKRSYCTKEEVAGSTFYAPFIGYCFKIPLVPGEILMGDNTDGTCASQTGTGIQFSVFNDFLPNGDVANFTQGLAGFSGVMNFIRDDTLTGPAIYPNGNVVNNVFNVTLALPDCPDGPDP